MVMLSDERSGCPWEGESSQRAADSWRRRQMIGGLDNVSAITAFLKLFILGQDFSHLEKNNLFLTVFMWLIEDYWGISAH